MNRFSQTVCTIYLLRFVANTIDGAVDAVRSLMTEAKRCEEMGMKARRHVEEIHGPVSAVRAFDSAVARISMSGLSQEMKELCSDDHP